MNYFQVVFTLPAELSRLALGNRRVIYNQLFASAWSALKKTIESEQGYDAAEAVLPADACEFGPFDEPADQAESPCPSCPESGGEMILQGGRDKSSWHAIMNSPARPRWSARPGSD